MDGTANHLLSKNALDGRILHIQSQKFSGVIPRLPQQKGRPLPHPFLLTRVATLSGGGARALSASMARRLCRLVIGLAHL